MSQQFKVLVATSPFGATGQKQVETLKATGWELIHNPYGRRLRGEEVAPLLRDVDAVIAGTEPYQREQLETADRLKVISRVGIGLDSVDLDYCAERGIQVTYTPDAPSRAVAELTVANIINLLRHVRQSDTSVRMGAWNRLMGLLVQEATIGVIGVGRIGSLVIEMLQPFGGRILACDTNPAIQGSALHNVEWRSMDEILAESNLVSVHVPLNKRNRGLIDREAIGKMKTGSALINTARGGIVDELALVDALHQRHLSGVALDVFEKEPYEGPLTEMDNAVLTAHIGASARASRNLMELGATEDCVRALRGEPVAHDAIADTLEP